MIDVCTKKLFRQKGKKAMQQIVTLFIECIQLLPISIKNKKDLIKSLKQIRAKLLKLLENSD